MYQATLGISTGGAGALILPNTGGNTTLMVVGYVSIAVGAVILLTSAARFVAKKAVKA